MLSLFVGGNYLVAEMDLTGSIDLPEPIAGVETIDFKISQKNKDKWNYLFGANYDIGKLWSVMAEVGFGGSRDNVIAGINYRW